jgi:hypothetical protein
MLVMAVKMRRNAGMSKQAKTKRTDEEKIHVRPFVDKQGYPGFLVQGWKEDSKWKRRQFKDEQEANNFVDELKLKAKNQGPVQRLLLTTLSNPQKAEAEAAVAKLGKNYSLADAVEFFLKHHRPPEFTIRLADALKLFLDDKEDELRPRTHDALKRSIERFVVATDNPWTHEVTQQQVEKFLRGLRAKDGTQKATKKTWNNFRNELGGFFGWCAEKDAATNRPFTFENPVKGVRVHGSRQVREGQSAKPITTAPDKVLRMFSTLSRWKGGVLTRYFALAYFAGIRPEEIERMSDREEELVNLKTRTITIPANISKTRDERKVVISDNLAHWLETAPGPIIPKNFRRMISKARKHFELTHDEARHSFISYHVALHRSLGDAALQAGNSERIIKKHYLNLHPCEDGDMFFRIVPDTERRRAVLAPERKKVEKPHLRAV